MKFYQRLKAPNDVNGNPRRVYVVYELAADNGGPGLVGTQAVVTAVYDEGYAGRPRDLYAVPDLHEASITATEYKAWLKHPKRHDNNRVIDVTKGTT